MHIAHVHAAKIPMEHREMQLGNEQLTSTSSCVSSFVADARERAMECP